MHLLTTSSTNLDEIVEAVDLGQPPGDIAVLSFADSDLAGLAAAWEAERAALPSVRLAHLRDLRHPMSVDLWIDRVGAHAKVIVVRLLGGLDWWKYGIERLSALARERGIALAVLPGEDRDDAAARRRLDAAARTSSTRCCVFSAKAAAKTCARCCAGSPAMPDCDLDSARSRSRCRAAPAICRAKARSTSTGCAASLEPGKPVVPIIFYRAHAARGRYRADRRAVRGACGARPCAGAARRHQPEGHARRPRFCATLWRGCVPPSSSPRRRSRPAAMSASRRRSTRPACRCCRSSAPRRGAPPGATAPRGLGAADLAMHVVLPELDGRMLAGAVAFKDPLPPQDGLAFTALASRPEPTASRWSRTASPRSSACAHCRAASAASPC